MVRSSLRWKLTLPMLAAVALFGLISTFLWSSRYEEELVSRFEDDGLRSTALFAEAVASALWEFDQLRATQTLAGLKDWETFVYAQVRDRHGVFVADGRQGASTQHLASAIDALDFGERRAEAGGHIFFIVPLEQESHGVIGHLVAGFSKEPVMLRLQEARWNGAIVSAVSFGLMGILLLILAESVIRPLTRATVMIDRVAAGDLDFTPTDTHRSDEVGRIARAVDVFRRNAADLVDVKARASADRQIAAMALVDHLTGLPNRRALEQKVAEICREPDAQTSAQFAVLHMDLDGFKEINDTLGHGAGDAVLTSVARLLECILGGAGFCARVGGDEFAAIVSADDPVRAGEKLAGRVVAGFQFPFSYEGQSLRIGCSIGIATCRALPEMFAEALVNADIALYRAKAEGKNRFVTFSDSHRRAVLARKALADELFRAVEAFEFVPYYQPQIDASSGALVGVEVLARWQHPQRGLLPPGAFLQLSEDLMIIRAIDQQIFNLAIAQFQAWDAEGIRLPRLAFNVSAKRLFDPDLLVMLDQIRSTAINVDIELLETVYLDNASDQILSLLEQIRSMGVRIHIDDFGTGHASFAGLLQVAPDVLKIDRQFVLAAPSSPRDRDVVALLIEIAKTLGTITVAEGVETEAHAALMRELGVDILQGYACGHPMPAHALLARLTGPQDTAAVSTRAMETASPVRAAVG